jgi:DNA-directed RNA polymerase, subunit RPC10 (contains C4-type Zn-finger)
MRNTNNMENNSNNPSRNPAYSYIYTSPMGIPTHQNHPFRGHLLDIDESSGIVQQNGDFNNSNCDGSPGAIPVPAPPAPPECRFPGTRNRYNTPDGKVYYTCKDCGAEEGFEANQQLRCDNCGGRIMMKQRKRK